MTIEMITALSSVVIALCTLGYTIISSHKQSVLQFITANRMDWHNQVRQLLGDFAHSYRTHNLEEMIDIEARLELFIRKDLPDSQHLFNHLQRCIKSEYCEDDYQELLALATYTIARSWQRIKIEVKTNYMPDKKAYQRADKEVGIFLDVAMSYEAKHRDKS